MTYDRLIHDYLDEGLSDTMQESLFNELANNSELRNEFNKQLKLQQMAKETFENTAPPVDLTNKIFTSVGFSAPYASVPGFKLSYIFALIPFLMLTIGIANYDFLDSILNNDDNVVKNERLLQNDLTNANSSGAEGNSNSKGSSQEVKLAFAQIEKNDNSNINSLTKRNNVNYSKSNGVRLSSNSTSSNSNSEKFAKDNISYLHELNMDYEGKPFFYISSSEMARNNVKILNLNTPSVISNQPILINQENINGANNLLMADNSRMSISARAINNSSLYKSDFFTNIPVANYAVNLSYKLDKDWALYAEYSNENYYQEFQNSNSSGLNFETKQNPVINVLSVGVRHNLNEMFNSNKIFPYVQLGAGYTTIGPVAKLLTGLEIRITNNISFVPSYEFSSLIFKNQTGTYYSFNNGFSLGLNYNFWDR